MKTNLETKLGRKVKKGHQIHHVIPDNRVRGNPLAREAYDRNLYDLDRASNLKELPKRGKPGEIVHRDFHSKWDTHVNEVLNIAKSKKTESRYANRCQLQTAGQEQSQRQIKRKQSTSHSASKGLYQRFTK